MKAKINVVGLGIKGITQITNQGLDAIKNSARIYYLGPDFDQIIKKFDELGVSIESIMYLYIDGELDSNIYNKVFEFLITNAHAMGNISLLVPGHPRFGVSVVNMLEKNDRNIEVNTIPGISCIDTLTNDLKRDPIEFGSVLIDVNRLLLYDIPLSPSLDIYIFHVCSIGTSRVYLSDAKKENKILLLKEHLKKFYPPDKKVYLTSSPMSEDELFEIRSYKIEEIEDLLNYVHFGATLYIPGERPYAFNAGFLNLLSNKHDKKTPVDDK